MFRWRNLNILIKIALLAFNGALMMALVMWGISSWQSNLFSRRAAQEAEALALNDLGDIALGIYNMVRAQDETVQQQVNYNLKTARYVLTQNGVAQLSAERTVAWTAANQYTLQSLPVRLPQMLIGGRWLGENSNPNEVTPIVDEIVALVGGTATIFQRMNEQGDMLRVATNVLTVDGRRAIGTYIPAIDPNGTPNSVVAAVLRGETYQGSAYVVSDWYLTAYEPIYDGNGDVIGMLYVGVRREGVESLRQAVLDTKVGASGYTFVLGAQGDQQGVYLVSEGEQLDGVSVWNTMNADERYVAREIVDAALKLEPGELATLRYRWQSPDETEPQWRISRFTYYQPWDWVIAVTAYESEILAYQDVLQGGRADMLRTLGIAGVLILVLVSGLSVLLARSIAGPINRLAGAAQEVAAGNLELQVDMERGDEAGLLAHSFNQMTARLRGLVASLESQVAERTRDLTQRSAYLAGSAEVGRAVTQILDVESLLSQVVELIRDSFGLYYVGLFLADEEREWAVLRAGTGEAGQKMLSRQHRIRIGDGMIGWSVAHAQPRIALDVGEDAVRLASSELPNTRSEAALPLRSRGRVLGALSVQSAQPSAFDESAIAVLQMMADQVAVALDNARLFSSAQQALDAERRAYGDLTQQAWLATLRARAERGYRADSEGVRPLMTLPALPQGSRAVLSAVSAVPGASASVRFYQEDPYTVVLPLRIREQPVGLVRLQKPQAAGGWGEEELALMSSVVEQMSVALESARLYQDTQDRAQQERLIGEVTSRIRETLDIERMLRIAADELRARLGLERLVVRLGVPEGQEMAE
ncbi:MAG: Methyl-accepting chemotaxis protein McpB [Chloroflexi bacterium ADurb.Bin360]|nr:MAG: Methyl-accepting chemotaxis protein McpB [Chloroflexi bacterium ADurb.Bin360]